MSILWLILAILMGILEAATVQLVSVWFAVGAVASCITSLFVDDVWIQLGVFIAVTIIALIITRPIAKRITKFSKTRTNSDRYIGKTAVVISDIDNSLAQGQVKVESSVWSARSIDNTVIKEGTQVLVTAIEGVKLIVEETDK